jgi:NAD(P)-dependent dehydrogenase (short-subunit alcohol dehydrogenase family)
MGHTTNQRFDGRVAVVTGGASGIGYAISQHLVEEGATVVIFDIRDAEIAAKEISERAIGYTADVSDEASVQSSLQAVVDRLGCLDVLVNNAGVDGAITPLSEYPTDFFDQVVAVNLRGVFLGMKHAIPHLAASRGNIVNIASALGVKMVPQLSAYCATKAGVVALTKSAALEYAAAGVRINAVLPGGVETPLQKKFHEENPALTEAMIAQHPFGRFGQPAEIAATVAFLASDDAAFTTGAALTADGGYAIS